MIKCSGVCSMIWLRRLLRRPEAALFVLVFGTYAYFYQAGGWNQNTRLDLVWSIVENGSAQIDAYHANTGDKAKYGDHYYCDKAPGASWLAVPAYGLVRTIVGPWQPDRRYLALSSYVVTVWAVSLPAAVGVVMLYMALGTFGLSPPTRAAFALAYGLGTLAFPYATLFYGHQLASALLVAAFALLVRARHKALDTNASPGRGLLAAVGILLGYAEVVDYPSALAIVALCAYAAWFVRPRSRLVWVLGGMAGPAVALALYHLLLFGSPFTLPYNFSTQMHRQMGFFMGMGAPMPLALVGILFDYRGLFYSAPWLLLAVPGMVVLMLRPRHRPEAVLCAVIVILFVWLNSSLVDWQGGWGMGSRQLIPAIPFLTMVAAGVALAGPTAWGRVRRIAVWVGFALVGGGSALVMLAGTAVHPEVPISISRPLEDYLLPNFFAGKLAINTQSVNHFLPNADGPRYAWNLGELLGLSGLSTLLPLAAFALTIGIWLWWTLRASPSRQP